MPQADIDRAAARLDCPTVDLITSDRAKRITITVHPGGRVAVTVPRRASQRAVGAFLTEQRDWINRQLAKQTEKGPAVYLPAGRQDYLRHRERCRTFVHACLVRHNQIYGFKYQRVAIKNLSSRWGSCSESGNLNFNYKIVHLPGDLAEYIVVHELCHLGELNHSPRFWRLVSQTIPDYRDRRRQLNRYVI
jgi:predicted metal-dependent hydrolase